MRLPVLMIGFLKFVATAAISTLLVFGQLSVKPVALGGLHVEGNKLVDAASRTILLQGTQAPIDLTLQHAGTMFSTIRQRWNMNALRLPLSVNRSERDPAYLPLVTEMVRRANQSELVVILAAVDEGAKLPTARTEAFWKKWAAQFKDNPNVLFDLFDDPQADAIPGHRPGIRTDEEWQIWQQSMQRIVDVIRSTGANQVIAAMAFEDDLLLQDFSDRWLLRDPNVIYEVCPNNRIHSTDSARDRDFGLLAARIPIMAMDWDPQLDQDNAECRSMPRDPKAAAAAIGSHMQYFDNHNISWLASSFTPGKLIFGLDAMEPTELYKVDCGSKEWPTSGIGLEVQLHQWSMTRANLITVSAGAGGIVIPQGGIAIGYAEITKIPEAANTWPLPTSLGGIAVRITDSAGTERWAPLLYAGIGNVNFLVDQDTAPGMAQVELVREDGKPNVEGCVIVERVSAGLFSATMNARGPAIGMAIQQPISGPKNNFLIHECDAVRCWTVPIRLSAETATRVELYGTGFRNETDPLKASIGGKPVRILDAGPQPGVPYNDRLVLELGSDLTGLGEEDLVFFAGSKVSNVVRIRVE